MSSPSPSSKISSISYKHFPASFTARSSIHVHSQTAYTHSSTASDWNQQEPFETYKLKIPKLCLEIGLEEPLVEHMYGGSFNRVSKLTFAASGDQYVLRVPRKNDNPEKTARDVRDQIAINSFVATLFPVPGIVAYDSTDENAIGAPYVIQKFAPGQRLDEVLENEILAIEDCLQIASIVADIFVRMQRVLNTKTGRLVSGPNIPHRCDDVSTLSTFHVVAPIIIDGREVPGSTLPGSIADLLKATLALRYEKKDYENLMPVWSRLGQISQEMKSRGLLVCNQSVLWHWDFAPRNILVGCTPGNKKWEVTAVLDWDGVLYAPRVLTREPPVWLWQIGDESSRATSDCCFDIPKKPLTDEEIIKQHFEDCLDKAGIDIEAYRIDAYDHGRWVRRLFSFIQLENAFIHAQDWEKYDLFINEWDAYCLEHPIPTENPDNSNKDEPDHLEQEFLSESSDNVEPPAALLSKDSERWEKWDSFIEEWTAYCLENPATIEEASVDDPTTAEAGNENTETDLSIKGEGRNALSCPVWISSSFRKLVLWRHPNA